MNQAREGRSISRFQGGTGFASSDQVACRMSFVCVQACTLFLYKSSLAIDLCSICPK